MHKTDNHKILEKLNEEDLREIKRLIKTQSIEKEIEKNLEKFKKTQNVCPVCHTAIAEGEGLILLFGPAELRQKAIFDGKDCLEYFLSKIKG